MKNLYPKGKVKIHPSPASPSGGGSAEALAVLKLLPVAILALTAVLGAEDKEVLAYLMTRSISGPVAPTAGEERRRCRRLQGGVHQAVLDCGCFDCYTSFWSRWDCSPDRELIHQAIEAFEEHLATSERRAGCGKGRRRERNRPEKGKNSKERERKRAGEAEEKVADESAVTVAGGGETCSGKMEAVVEVMGEETEEVSGDEFQQPPPLQTVALDGERRRGWQDVMGLFNSRVWSLWSPGV